MNWDLHPGIGVRVGGEYSFAAGCTVLFAIPWGIVRSSLNPRLMALIPTG